MSKSAYLGAKWIANTLYLALLSLFVLPVGLYHFLRSGVGPFDALQFFVPMLLVVLPAAAFVSAAALLFDVTPVLRSRGGLVLWFLFGALPMMAIPMELARGGATQAGQGLGPQEKHFDHVPAFDPVGMAMHEGLVNASLPPGAENIASGYVVHDQPAERVAWPGLKFPSGMVRQRLLNLLWVFVPFGLAVLIFDRFDPAREGRRLRLRRQRNEQSGGAAAAVATTAPARTLASLARVEARPGARAAILAEARLLWETGNWAKWLLIPAVLAAALVPGDGARMAGGAVVLLLIPLISEVACREDLAGARPLVFSQPGVPSSAVLWKFAAVTLFLLVATLPIIVRGLVTADARAYSVPLGVLFVAAFAVGSAALSGGGKLFSGVVLLLWYLALNGLGAVDFLGILSKGASWDSRLVFLLVGAAFLGTAMAVERRRARGV